MASSATITITPIRAETSCPRCTPVSTKVAHDRPTLFPSPRHGLPTRTQRARQDLDWIRVLVAFPDRGIDFKRHHPIGIEPVPELLFRDRGEKGRELTDLIRIEQSRRTVVVFVTDSIAPNDQETRRRLSVPG